MTEVEVPTLRGSVQPRLSTPGGGASFGPDAAALAERVGLPLMDWQRLTLNRGMRTASDGGWLHSQVGVVVARGNGKSTLLAVRALWGLLRGEQVLGVAQSLSTADQPWHQVLDWLESHEATRRLVEHVDRSRGSRAIRLTNGAAYLVRSQRRATRGVRAHLVLADELREWRDLPAWGGLVGTLAGLGVQRNTQLWATSNAGDDDSVVLNHLRDEGRRLAAAQDGSRSLCWLEWSARPDRSVLDPTGWAEANPALGVRVRADMLAEQADAQPEVVYRTEFLSQWVSAMSAAIPDGAWQQLAEQGPLDPVWPAALGVELSFDRAHAAVVLAAQDPDGVTHVRLLYLADLPAGSVSVPALAGEVQRWRESTGAATVALDPRACGPLVDHLTATLGDPLVTRVGPGRLSEATGELLARAEAGTLRHDGDARLAEHVTAAGVKHSNDAGLVLSRRVSSGPIAAAVATALAVYGVAGPEPAAPAVL